MSERTTDRMLCWPPEKRMAHFFDSMDAWYASLLREAARDALSPEDAVEAAFRRVKQWRCA